VTDLIEVNVDASLGINLMGLGLGAVIESRAVALAKIPLDCVALSAFSRQFI
jgi:hypothetical protein